MAFAAAPGRHFWSNGSAWGMCLIEPEGGDVRRVDLTVLHGTLRLRRLQLTGWGAAETGDAALTSGEAATLRIKQSKPTK
jgi:hypothetical protein